MSGELVDFCTVTPAAFTSAGSCDAAWLWRIWARIWAVFGSVLPSKFTVRVIAPLFALTDDR